MDRPRTLREATGISLEEFLVRYRLHAVKRMFERNILDEEVVACLEKGEVIEMYPMDFPFPSFLLNGLTTRQYPLHLVISINYTEKVLYVITAYIPDRSKWENNFSKRVSQ